MVKEPTVSVIVVNFNERKHLKTCLSSLCKQTYKNFEIILVDNGSEDGSVEFVKRNFPKVKIIESGKDLGYASGNALGVKNSKGEYIFFVSPDTETDKNCLKELIDCVKRNKCTIACSKILLFYERDKINTTGMAFHYLGFGWCDNIGKIDNDQFEEKEITFPSGTAFLIDKKKFFEVNGFDENYFMYYEDSDLGWKIRLRGYKIMFVPKAKVYHKYAFSRYPYKFYFAERNRIVTILKNYQQKTLYLILPPFLLTEIGLLFYSIASGLFLSKLKGYYWIFRNMDKILETRKLIQKTRKIKDKDIVKYFFSKIEFKEITNPIVENVLNPILDVYWNVIKRFI